MVEEDTPRGRDGKVKLDKWRAKLFRRGLDVEKGCRLRLGTRLGVKFQMGLPRQDLGNPENLFGGSQGKFAPRSRNQGFQEPGFYPVCQHLLGERS